MAEPPEESSPVKRPSLVVVGAGMTTHSLLQHLERCGGLAEYRVTVIGEEPRACYDRVNLTSCFAGAEPDDLLLAPADWYAEHGVRMLTGARATRIDRAARLVETDTQGEIHYDQVVLATGSRPFVPPIDGVDSRGVFLYRTIEDIHAIKSYARGRKTAAVLGGGLLGLEAGKALHDLQMEAHVVEVAPGLMPRQLNSEAAGLLKDEVESLGVTVHLLRRAVALRPSQGGVAIDFAGHSPLSVDMVVISAGIRPRDELAREAGLACGERGGIAINKSLQTDDPRVFAIGECASLDNELFGLVGPCYEMAEALAANLAAMQSGQQMDARFESRACASRLKLMGVDVSTLGVPIGEASDAVLRVAEGEGYCRSLIVEKRRVIGAIAVGDWPERERLSGLIAERRRVSDRQLRRFQTTGSLWAASEGESITEWPAAATVCSCLSVTRGELTDAMLAGADTADALADATGASTVCGSCRNLLCAMCEQPEATVGSKGRGALLGASVFAALVTPFLMAYQPRTRFADTVQSAWRQVDFLWQDPIAKQVTGYTLLAISVLALLLSLRKRITRFNLGDFNLWRGIHGVLGAATLVGFLVHTGMSLGHNFTFALGAAFLLLNLVGALTGVAAALESRSNGPWGRKLRAWRPRLTQAHIWLFWPLPALVLFHIISVYYY